MNNQPDNSRLNDIMKSLSEEDIQARFQAASELKKAVDSDPEIERLAKRPKSIFTGTLTPDVHRLPVETESHDLPQQGSTFEGYMVLCDISANSSGNLWLVRNKDATDGPTMVLRVLADASVPEKLREELNAKSAALTSQTIPGCPRILHHDITSGDCVYRVAEFIPGLTITQHCDDESLSISDRVRLFQQVCIIVDNLHRSGFARLNLHSVSAVVTPANDEATASVSLVDFTPETVTSENPLPAEAIRDDVRSLGLLLLELLTGLPEAECRAAAEESSPPRPGKMVRKRSFAVPAVARKRQGTPVDLEQQMAGILDHAVMRCLGHTPHVSAAELASDVQQFLTTTPEVEDSWIRRLTKRHR